MKKLLLVQDEDGRRMEEKEVLYKFGSKLQAAMHNDACSYWASAADT